MVQLFEYYIQLFRTVIGMAVRFREHDFEDAQLTQASLVLHKWRGW
jgi:hypothetical protein